MEPLSDRQAWRQVLGIPPRQRAPLTGPATQKHALTRTEPRAPIKRPTTIDGFASHGTVGASAGQHRNATQHGASEKSSTSEAEDESASSTSGHSSVTSEGSRSTPISSEQGSESERDVYPSTAPSAPSARSSRSTSASSAASDKSAHSEHAASSATARAHELDHALSRTRPASAKIIRNSGWREPLAEGMPTTPEHPDRHPSHAFRGNPSPERKTERKKKVYCGNNRFDPSLKSNGGTLDIGTRSACMRAGFGAALYQHVTNEDEFIRKFSARYAPLIEQKLYFKDGPVPEGYQPATLSQARLRGWGAGSAELARRLRAKRRGLSDHRRETA